MTTQIFRYYITPLLSVDDGTKYLLRKGVAPTNDEITKWAHQGHRVAWTRARSPIRGTLACTSDYFGPSIFRADETVGLNGSIDSNNPIVFKWGCFMGNLIISLYKVSDNSLIAQWDTYSLVPSLTDYLDYNTQIKELNAIVVNPTSILETDKFYLTFESIANDKYDTAHLHLHSKYNDGRDGIYSIDWIEVPIIIDDGIDEDGAKVDGASRHKDIVYKCCNKETE